MLNCRIKKIILLLDNHFCERDYNRFGVELLKDNGFDVLVWEVTPIINPEGYYNITVTDRIEYKGYRVFYKIREVQNSIINLENNCLFILFSNYCYSFYKILMVISSKKFPYCYEVSGGSYPQSIDCLNQLSKINKLRMIINNALNKIKKINYKYISEYIFRRIPYRLLRLNPADFIIAGGGQIKYSLI